MRRHALIIIVLALVKCNYGFFDQFVVNRFGFKHFNDLSNVDISKRCPKDQKCIFKCCVEGYAMSVFKECEASKKSFSNVTIYDQRFGRTNLTLEKTFKLVPGLLKDPIFALNSLWWYKAHLIEDGRLFLKFPNVYNRWKEIDNKHFCVDMKTEGNVTRPVFMVEYGTELPRKPSDYKKWALIVSTIFLLLTLATYGVFPQLRDLNGIVFMTQLCCLILTFVMNICLESYHTMKLWMSGLLTMTFIYYFLKVSSFCWTNIMFYRLLTARSDSKDISLFKIWKNMLKYCVYAFGLPLFLTITVATIELSDMTDMPSFVTPQIQNRGNFSFHEMESIYYLYIPLMLILAFNWICCFIKVVEFCRTSQQFAMVADGEHAETFNRPMQFVKLLVLLTFNAILELVTVMYPKGTHDITSTYILFIGAIVLIIFVLDQSVRTLLLEKTHDLKAEASNSNAFVAVFSKK